ncbi:MAG: glycosyltransferase family 2 protein [Lachnospiraceae bacterium]|jgi:Glycosyltransferases, probably involved in cell wall biogenesis|uniref:glycosyltransferase family 2 protein n=1 Tax=Roseburia sp. 1XD42-69 TaxID=2320088 RepID=UPI000EA168EF|nr:glycosyltransferase family 2 protein [Roseburia sp. 1XD42-69]MCI8876213.1 glycosyltransferase family 2 protein [Lachnospiraceae bacterium]RKJ68132.1 glycosyltransferase family 2 protein [Roseburia sp. 1XD42-69]
MGKVRVSVALASYNGERYIREQIESILANLKEEDEIVVSDDGSKDNTLAFLQEYQKGKISIRILKGPGKGIKKNFENALKHCRGEYIFLSDQDDVWTRDKVERVLPYLLEGNYTLVNHDARVMDGKLKKEIMPSFFEYRGSAPGFWKNYIKNRYMGCCMAFHRKLLSRALPIPEEIEMHDQWIGLINHIAGNKSLFLKEPLVLYRRHEKNVSDFTHGTVPVMIKKRLILAKALLCQGILKKH